MHAQTIIPIEHAETLTGFFDSPERYLFRTNDLIAGMSDEAFARFSNTIEILHCDCGEIIFRENDDGDCLYLIAQGSVKISKKGRGGQQETLCYLPERDFFGEMALVDTGVRSAQATAHGHTVLGRVGRDAWKLLFEVAAQEVLANFMRAVTRRLRHNNQHFIEQMMQNERLSLLGTTVSAIAHDMNNPIACIVAACEVMQARIQDEVAVKMTGMIRDAVDKMDAMTRELVDFSRGNMQLALRSVSIDELLKGLAQDFAKCAEAGIRVQREIRYGGSIRGDLHRLLRVFGNVIRNAREAMKNQGAGELRFVVQRDERSVTFEISDDGCGIPAELLPRIFEPFVTHGKENGTGLGLAISKAIVEAHGGTISATSAPNAGTTFSICLPTPE